MRQELSKPFVKWFGLQADLAIELLRVLQKAELFMTLWRTAGVGDEYHEGCMMDRRVDLAEHGEPTTCRGRRR